MSLQVCHCGWSKVTSYQGLRIHQGKKGCTPKRMAIPESEAFRMSMYRPSFLFTSPSFELTDPFHNIFTTSMNSETPSVRSLQVDQDTMGPTPRAVSIPDTEQEPRRNHSTLVQKENVLMSPNLIAETNPALIEIIQKLIENQQPSRQMEANLDRSHQALDFTPWPQSQAINTENCSAATDTTVQETNQSLFRTPPSSHDTAANMSKARRALDFSTGAQQVQQAVFQIPTTTAQQRVVPPKTEEREKERKRKQEAEKLLKARQDRMRAALQQKIQAREHKMDDVLSSLKARKGSLDAEWLEINGVFSEVMKAVEAARAKALQPLEERRQKVKQKAQHLVQKLEREIDKLKKTIDELDKNPDLQVCPPTGLDESGDWKNPNVDSLLSFGSLKPTTSAMMEQIEKNLESLSSMELKRISKFAVDVRLDPATAHQCLDVSDDGKNVRDGGRTQRLPDAPARFDRFGSILALNSLSSGKSYWEVEVSNKTGWDLGVARGDANRKGKLLLSPDDGYWVTVHYEDKKYAALTAPPVSLSLREKPQKVGVFVDYEEGLVSFYDVTAESHIYSFTKCSFSGKIFPYFSPHLNQNGKNSDPLIIAAVRSQQCS